MLRGFVNTFAGNPLDRAADRRGDLSWQKAAILRPDALALVLSRGRPLVEADPGGDLRIAYVRGDLTLQLSAEAPAFLGLWKETPIFAVEVEGAPPLLAGAGGFEELREIALRLPATEAAICATAKGLFAWRERHRFCANCGAATESAEAGWKRRCAACNAEHFPRTDPVVIMLATYQDRCLVGRQERWPARMFSALAGFVEPGESIEEACARELKEEAGLTAVSVRYHSSQPWPYPSSLMIGLIAEVTGDQVVPDPVEVHEHHWLTRDEARAVIAGTHPLIRKTSPVAIAHSLLSAWAEGE